MMEDGKCKGDREIRNQGGNNSLGKYSKECSILNIQCSIINFRYSFINNY